MADAHATTPKNPKRRKMTENSGKTKKNLDILSASMGNVGLIHTTPSTLSGVTTAATSATAAATAVAATAAAAASSNPGHISAMNQSGIEGSNQGQNGQNLFKKIYHLGGIRYLIFHGHSGVVEEVILKEWDAARDINKKGVKLNLSKLIMILHNVEIINQAISKIQNGEPEVDVKIHIGQSHYLTCDSEFNTVGVRIWRKFGEGEMKPTKTGQNMSFAQWKEFAKVANEYYATHMEIFTFVPCLLNPYKPDHDRQNCKECGKEEASPQGEVNFDIPI